MTPNYKQDKTYMYALHADARATTHKGAVGARLRLRSPPAAGTEHCPARAVRAAPSSHRRRALQHSGPRGRAQTKNTRRKQVPAAKPEPTAARRARRLRTAMRERSHTESLKIEAISLRFYKPRRRSRFNETPVRQSQVRRTLPPQLSHTRHSSQVRERIMRRLHRNLQALHQHRKCAIGRHIDRVEARVGEWVRPIAAFLGANLEVGEALMMTLIMTQRTLSACCCTPCVCSCASSRVILLPARAVYCPPGCLATRLAAWVCH
jgi:hypothetical protein